MEISTRNVNTAFKHLVMGIYNGDIPTVKEGSRNGAVLRIPEPVLIRYSHPRERVLFNRARDANCFFHFFEAMWMLSGDNRVEPLRYYVKRMEDFSDDGVILNGAYGHRWRHAGHIEKYEGGPGEYMEFDTDQLDLLVQHLQAAPNSRRAVLAMWNVEDDLLQVKASKDVCCNLNVMFWLRKSDALTNASGQLGKTYLDMTVTNRSNDLIWGLLGANYVHFSYLQEYMAARLGVEVGTYYHFTNNLHVYEDNWEPVDWLAEDFAFPQVQPPLFPALSPEQAAFLDEELPLFVEANWDTSPSTRLCEPRTWGTLLLNNVGQPLLQAFHAYKRRGATCMMWARQIQDEAWRIAAMDWLDVHLARRERASSDR